MSLEKMIENLEPLAYHEVDVKTLSKLVNPLACWRDLESPITVDEVLECVKNGKEELIKTPTPFENLYGGQSSEILTTQEMRERHIKKVAFFVKNEIEMPVSIDVGIPSLGAHIDYIIDDGNHRLAGAIIKGAKTVKCKIGGAEDYAKELGIWNPNQAHDDLMKLFDELYEQKKAAKKIRYK